MGRDHAVTLLKTPVLPDVVEVIPTERDRAFHLGRAHDALQDAAADAHVAREGALFVDVVALNAAFGVLKPRPTDLWYREARFLLVLDAH